MSVPSNGWNCRKDNYVNTSEKVNEPLGTVIWYNFGIQIKYLHPSLIKYPISQNTLYEAGSKDTIQLICVERPADLSKNRVKKISLVPARYQTLVI
jgi:hypothetical protein